MQLVTRALLTLWGLAALAGCAQGAAVDPQTARQSPAEASDSDAAAAEQRDGDGSVEEPSGRDAASDPDAANPGAPSGLDAGQEAGADPDDPTSDAGGPVPVAPDAGGESGGEPDAAVVLPPDPCAELCNSQTAPDAKTCDGAVTIGRKAALADDFVYNGDTRGDGNNQDLTFINCADGNTDNFFRIYLYKDESITIGLATAEYDPVIKLVQGASCAVADAAACVDRGLDGESEVLNVSPIPSDGWYYVVADGPYGSTALEGQGRYTLTVSVAQAASPAAGSCSCP